MLDVAAKRRLTGAVVLVVLAVVFLPMMMEEDALEDPVPEDELAMPEPPPRAGGRQAEIFQNFDAPGGGAGPGLAADYAPEPDSDAELEALPNLGDEVPAPEPAEAATPVLAPDTAAAAASAEKTTQETAPEAPKSATVAAPARRPREAQTGAQRGEVLGRAGGCLGDSGSGGAVGGQAACSRFACLRGATRRHQTHPLAGPRGSRGGARAGRCHGGGSQTPHGPRCLCAEVRWPLIIAPFGRARPNVVAGPC